MERDLHLVRKIGQAARAGFRKVFEGWDSKAYWPINRTVEAQIAAASLGYKPLYWDPWGQDSARLCAELRRVISADAVVDASDVGLVVFQPNVITPILEADPAFYRPHGESILTAVRRVCRTRQNGELLGYGVRSADTAGAVPVRILNAQADLFARFMSDPRGAEVIVSRLRCIPAEPNFPSTQSLSPSSVRNCRSRKRINTSCTRHSLAAREIARQFFEAEKVIRSLLERAGI